MGDLSEHFDSKEYACKCGCGLKYPSPALAAILEEIRKVANVPVTIQSGWRCTFHNREDSKVLGKQGFIKGQCGDETASAHTHGEAADISAKGMSKAFLYGLIQKMHDSGAIPELRYAYIIKKSIASVHVDVDTIKKRSTIWGGEQ